VSYRVALARQAERAVKKLPPADRTRILSALHALAEDPRRSGKHVKALKGSDAPFLRYRVGDHRIMYEVDDSEREVLVHGIVARKDLERWLRSR
jgi:mRNA interferase RelE/StbE